MVTTSGIQQGLSYDLIYLGLKMELCKLAGEEFYCTSSDMARAYDLGNQTNGRFPLPLVFVLSTD